jgi:putative ABC transport system permease protein
MGRAVLVLRLAGGSLRRHRGQALLLLVVIAAATSTLTLGLVLHGTADQPWGQTRAATAGPDVVAATQGRGSVADLAALARAPGVQDSAGPYPVVTVDLRYRGLSVTVNAQGRDTAPAAIDRPDVTAGSWIRPGGAVLERSLAETLGVGPGGRVTLAGQDFAVAGLAVTTAWPAYPLETPGLIWLTQPDARRLVSPGDTLSYTLDLRLAAASAAASFADAHTDALIAATSWQSIEDQDGALIKLVRLVLLIGSWLLALLALCSLAVLVGGRMAEQTRRVGLLKAVGASPRLIAVTLLAEHLLVAALASAVGLVVGRLGAPLLADPGAGLIGGHGPVSLSMATAAAVAGAAMGVTGAATLLPVLRGARSGTISALTGPSRAPRRRSLLNAFSARLPVALLLGLRLAARRPRRALASAAGMLVTVAMIVVAISVQRTLSSSNPQLGGDAYLPGNALAHRVDQVAVTLTAALVLLAVINTVFVTWAMIVDTRRTLALARALGATPLQTSAGLSTAQLIPALAAAVLGIPAGLGLFEVVASITSGGGARVVAPSAWSLLSVLVGTLAAVAALTVATSRLTTRQPVAQALGAH